MTTFKAVVQRHQLRRDGKYPVSIRIIHHRTPVYIPTGLYASPSQINKKTFEIKDQFLLTRTGQTIATYERKLLSMTDEELRTINSVSLRRFLTNVGKDIDFLGACRDEIENGEDNCNGLKSSLKLIDEMGITRMMATDFTSQFIYRFKEYMDERTIPVFKNGKKVGEKPYSAKTKNRYLVSLCHVFRMLQKKYNSEFDKPIPHDPFVGLEYYKESVTPKRSMDVDSLRAFFKLTTKSEKSKIAQDVMLLSFCLCGLNVIDLFTLKKSAWDKKENRINYHRRKTEHARHDDAFSSIRIEPEISDVFRHYLADSSSEYLFDFHAVSTPEKNARNICMCIDRLCKENNFMHVSQYWFRHTWATIARNDCDVSKDDIDLCLNHTGNNPMADVYIKPDWSRIDRANRKVLDFVFGKQEN